MRESVMDLEPEVRDEGVEVRDLELEVRNEGVEVSDRGIEVRDEGVEVRDRGLEVRDLELDVGDEGVEVRDLELVLGDEGVEVRYGGLEVGMREYRYGIWDYRLRIHPLLCGGATPGEGRPELSYPLRIHSFLFPLFCLLSYFILDVPKRKCLGEDLCRSSTFYICVSMRKRCGTGDE